MQMQSQGFAPRQMVNVAALGLKCDSCGVDITELPFQPTKKEDGTYGRLFCRECNRNRKRSFGPR